MTNDTLLFAAAQIKKHCSESYCHRCIFCQELINAKAEIYDERCRFKVCPASWEIDDITGVKNRDK